jgi:damage-control phosphatase, subfamily III
MPCDSRLNTLFSLTEHWKAYDVFGRQKMSTFRSSRAAVLELAEQFMSISEKVSKEEKWNPTEKIEEADELLFEEMCEICLWGNATDLSLLTTLSYEDIQKLQGSKARQASKQNIVVDELAAAFKALRNDKAEERRVDIVLDNSGFELYVDLILASYLLTSKLAAHVVLHPKSIPWFVSDVIPADFASLLNILANPRPFYETPSEEEKSVGKTPPPLTEKELKEFTFIFQILSEFHSNGQLVIRPNRFWTHAGGYWRMPKVESRLFEDLKSSSLVIFKGDLNYRKLTGDATWDPTTPFAEAIGPLGPGSGLRTLALRTCKADVVVGLPEGEDERLRQTEGGGGDSGQRKWAWSGKWAVVQFCDGKA